MKTMTIGKKEVGIVESHQDVLRLWREYHINTDHRPYLITFDTHTDNKPAMNLNLEKGDISLLNNKWLQEICATIKNDEQIDTAIKLQLIKKAIIISFNGSSDIPNSIEMCNYSWRDAMIKELMGEEPVPIPNRPYSYPNSDIYVIGYDCFIGCTRKPHTEECEKPKFDQAIETIFLESRFERINEMIPGFTDDRHIVTEKYILDIDLDYFHTIKSLNPDNPELFYNLIRNAETITIAKESNYIDTTFDELDSELLLRRLIEHVKSALNVL